MKTVVMKISDLKTPEKNVRIHTESQIKEFIRSIKMFGQIRPVVVDEDNVILAGNGLVEALRQMNIDKCDVYKITDLTANQKKKLMIADNKIFSLGIENLETLNSFFEDLNGDLDIPGFDEEILRSMVAEADVITEKISEYGTLDEDEIETIRESSKKVTDASPYGDDEIEETNDNAAEDNNSESGEIRKSVVCPKCGETIWL